MVEDKLMEQMTLVYGIMAKDEFANAISTMLWNIYCKSIEKGFSEEQAMSITLSFAKSQGNN